MARRRPLPDTVRQRSATPASRLPARNLSSRYAGLSPPDCPPATSLHDPPASPASRQRPSPRSTQFAAIRPSVPAFRTSPATSHLHIAAILCPATEAPSRNRSPLPQPELPPPATGVLASPQPAVPGTKKRGTPQRHSPPSDNNSVPAATCRPRCSLSARPAP